MSDLVPSRRLPLAFDPAGLLADLSGLEALDEARWIDHFNARDYDGRWTSLPLRSLAGNPANIRPVPRAQVLFAPTPFLARCPHMAAVLDAFACPIGAARLLRLAAGSRILEHRDDALGFEDGEVRIHVPVATNDRVAFHVGGVRLDMKPGEAWYVDVRQLHRVDNEGATDRVHLVVDCEVNDWVRSLLRPATP